MTALRKYQRLEGPGLWRADPAEQRRDAVVALGEATLTITDGRSGAVLSHWSLPAIRRVNPGELPAIVAPGGEDATESLELDDPTLIEALETIEAALTPKPRWRRLRRGLAATGLAATIALGVFWLPDTLARHTAGLVPPAKRAQIGREALDDLFLTLQGARICAEPTGRQALATLRARVLGANYRVAVVAGVPGLATSHLPGRLVVVGQSLLERLDSPEALTGYLITEELLGEATDPLYELLGHAGLRATLALLTTGNLPREALAGYAARRLVVPSALPDPGALIARFEALGLSPAPFALSLPETAATLAQALADRPQGTARGQARLLSDGEWITLQNICVG